MFLRLKIVCLRVSYKKKYEKKTNFIASLKSLKKGSGVTDATLTPNQDYYWTGGPGRSSGITTFSGNLEICSSNHGGGNLTTTTYYLLLLRILHNWWPRRHATSSLGSSRSHIYCYQAFPRHHPAPPSSPGGAPSPTFLSGLLTPPWGGKYVTDATLTPNQDYYWTGGPGRSSGITPFLVIWRSAVQTTAAAT